MFFTLTVPGAEKTFSEKNSHFARMRVMDMLREMSSTHPPVVAYQGDPNLYTKLIVSPLKLHEREVSNYQKLDGLIPLPKLVYHEFLFEALLLEEDDDPDDTETFYVSVIVTERCGKSISDVYFGGAMQGPGLRSNHPNMMSECFPGIPKNIQDKIQDILDRLHSLGVVHDDVHSGNFLIDDNGTVTIIDLALTSQITTNSRS